MGNITSAGRVSDITRLSSGQQDLFEIQGSKESLVSAIDQHGEEVLQYKFKDGFQTYSPLEYAVKLGDRESAQVLITLGASVDDSVQSFGTMVHFFMDCLEEGAEPDLAMLELLLDNISDVNLVEAGAFYTSLERALMHMANYKKSSLECD